MKAAGCEMVVMGTIIRETIGTMAEARKTGFNRVVFDYAADASVTAATAPSAKTVKVSSKRQ